MKAFVTGATGFIGRRLVTRLLSQGCDVVALARNDNHGLPKGVEIAYGDILDPDALGTAGQGCDRLYHLAAKITFAPEQKAELLRVNGLGTSHVLVAARRWDVERSVVVSSACTIGLSHAGDVLLHEESPLQKELEESNPYMASKLLAEDAVRAAAKNQAVVIVNPSTVYGPGDFSLNSGTLIQKVAKALLLPVPPGGSNVVDVDDVVEGIIAAGEHGLSGERYILGGENLSFARIFSQIASVVNHRPLLIPIPGWTCNSVTIIASLAGRLINNRFLTGQMVRDLFSFKYYSSERAKQKLGWKPRFSFEESVKRSWAFYRQTGLVQ